MVAAFGSYLGETIRRRLGGQWIADEGDAFCLLNVGNTDTRVFPFSKMEKRFVNGIEDALADYCTTIKTAVAVLPKLSNDSSQSGNV